MKKLEEAVADLEYKELFGLNAPLLPPCPDFLQTAGGATALMAAEPIFKFFGIAGDETQTLTVSLARDLQAEWASHRSSYTPPAAGTRRPPAAVMAYWRGAAKLLPHLSKIACTRRLRPNGNAAPERFMSIIKNMDSVNARSTKAKTLYNVAFLRGNSPIVRLLLKRGANEMLSASERDGLARDAARQAVKEATLQRTLAQLLLAADAAASSDVAAAARGGKKEEEGEEGGGGEEEGEAVLVF